MKQKKESGFTLLELLVVLAIIGLLAGIISLAINNARVRGRDAKRVGDMRQMISSLEQYSTHNGVYPTGTASMAVSGSALDDSNALNGGPETFIPNYVAIIPKSPEPQDGSCNGGAGRGSNNYWYDSASDGSTYTLTFCLGKDNETWPAGIRSATPNGVQ